MCITLYYVYYYDHITVMGLMRLQGLLPERLHKKGMRPGPTTEELRTKSTAPWGSSIGVGGCMPPMAHGCPHSPGDPPR